MSSNGVGTPSESLIVCENVVPSRFEGKETGLGRPLQWIMPALGRVGMNGSVGTDSNAF